MKEYIVSARKYRPKTFADVVGQKSLTATLSASVTSGKLAHAYLFCGPRGTGKTTCARIFARAINCMQPTDRGEACNECESCKAFEAQRSLNIFELDAASNNSVENIKQLMEQTRIPPQIGKYKVFIIDEVHMLSTAAFNAFLKTLEEPPAHVIFILATTEKHKILPTILSRCQIYDFERITADDIVEHLKHVAESEGITAETEALALIAAKADGGMRDALSLFDQVASYCQGQITYEKAIEDLNVPDPENYFSMADMAIKGDITGLMLLLNKLLARGFDANGLVAGLASHLRNVLMANDKRTLPLIETTQPMRERFALQAQQVAPQRLYKALEILNQCEYHYRQSINKRLLVEITLIKMVQAVAANQPAEQPAAPVKQPEKQPEPVEKQPESKAAAPKTTEETAAKPAPQSPKPKIKGMGITFKQLREEAQPQAESIAEEPVPVGNQAITSFTQEELEIKWRAMCNRMPQEMKGISLRLKNLIPHIKELPNVELAVDSQIFLDQINQIKSRIRLTLANDLQCPALQLSLRLAEDEEVQMPLTQEELFEKMCKENPAVEQLRRQMDLELQ